MNNVSNNTNKIRFPIANKIMGAKNNGHNRHQYSIIMVIKDTHLSKTIMEINFLIRICNSIAKPFLNQLPLPLIVIKLNQI